ncbi:MAG: hypothetical protein RIC89_18130, partial [Pseudomonadales bacterium]
CNCACRSPHRGSVQAYHAPAPPYVIRQGTTADEVWSGLVRAYASSAATSARQALLLRDIVAVEKRDYLPVWAEYQRLRLDAHHL